MLIRFWSNLGITFLRVLHIKLVTALYVSIINIFWLLNLCGSGGDASFAPQANLVSTEMTTNMENIFCFLCLNVII